MDHKFRGGGVLRPDLLTGHMWPLGLFLKHCGTYFSSSVQWVCRRVAFRHTTQERPGSPQQKAQGRAGGRASIFSACVHAARSGSRHHPQLAGPDAPAFAPLPAGTPSASRSANTESACLLWLRVLALAVRAHARFRPYCSPGKKQVSGSNHTSLCLPPEAGI